MKKERDRRHQAEEGKKKERGWEQRGKEIKAKRKEGERKTGRQKEKGEKNREGENIRERRGRRVDSTEGNAKESRIRR